MIDRLIQIVSGVRVQLTPRASVCIPPYRASACIPPYAGKIRTKTVPLMRWCIWKPIFRWDECGKSVTWLFFYVGYVPWWLRKPIDINLNKK